MARQTIKRVQGDFQTEQLQRNTEEFLYRAVPDFVTDGVRLDGIQLASGATQVEHRLQRTPRGFLVLNINANTNVWATARSELTLTLNTTASAVVDLWVF